MRVEGFGFRVEGFGFRVEVHRVTHNSQTFKARFWPWLRPDSGLGFPVNVLKSFDVFPVRSAAGALFQYRDTSLIRKRHPVEPYGRTMPRVLGKSQGGGRFLTGEVPLYGRIR